MNNHEPSRMIADVEWHTPPDSSFTADEIKNFQTMAAKEQAEYNQQHQPVSGATSVYVGLVVAVVVAIVIGVIASIFMKKKQ